MGALRYLKGIMSKCVLLMMAISIDKYRPPIKYSQLGQWPYFASYIFTRGNNRRCAVRHYLFLFIEISYETSCGQATKVALPLIRLLLSPPRKGYHALSCGQMKQASSRSMNFR